MRFKPYNGLGVATALRYLPISYGIAAFHALAGETFKLAWTPGHVSSTYRRQQADGSWEQLIPNPTEPLSCSKDHQAFYKDLDGDGLWWLSSGRTYLNPEPAPMSQQELEHASQIARTE